LSNYTRPWSAHPPGVWTQQSRPDGSSVLVDFGGETSLVLRAWRRDVAAEPLGAVEALRIGERDFQLARPSEGAPLRARTEAGEAVVEVALTDRSGLDPDEALELLGAALGCVDYAWIAERSDPPAQIAITPDNLVPWPLHPTHPLASTLSCRVLPNGLGMGVAAMDAPWVSLISPEHAVWASLGPQRLLDVATLNLVRMAMAGEIPSVRRSVRDVHALAIGPHPLAVPCLLLPDLALWAKEVVGSDEPLWAVPLEPQLLLVVPERVELPTDAWAPPMRLIGSS
jgi:hypothetical protein